MTKSNSIAPVGQYSGSVVSLYSGAGGLDLGFARAGFNAVFANDIAPDATQTHKLLHTIQDPQWKDVVGNLAEADVHCDDVRNLSDKFYEGQADLVIGGPPCQGFSVAGRMDPNDPRSRHVFDFLGLVGRIKPKAFVMENVAALARNKRWKDVIAQLREEAALNYKVDLVVLDASEWGVPQKRLRMFLIGTPLDSPDLDFSTPPTRDNPPSVREALGQLPTYGEPGNDSLCTAKITMAKNPILRLSPYAGMLFNGQGRAINLDRPAPTLPASMGGNRTPIIDQDALEFNRPAWIEQYHQRLFVEKRKPFTELPKDAHLRRLTVEEAGVIQTFPRDTPFQGQQSSKFRQIGNAVPPMLGFAVANAVGKVLS
ncbi:DNA cytosine methyltransferase [Corynebacterium phoceense]|uniref:DNA cytosine methyltransferase n=1 Tax=Corynebacterium phoceense TaxID=1686286 RepID=UPI000839C5EE|nr:DNA cytosine methyltransferase [Corynebacterium phoceense]